MLILQAVAVPNPDPSSLAIQLAGPVDSVDLKLYSRGFDLVAQVTSGAQPSGWNRLDLSQAGLKDLPSGLYFGKLRAKRLSIESPAVMVKVLLLH